MKFEIDTVKKNNQSNISDKTNNDSLLVIKTNSKLSFIQENLVKNIDNEEVLKKSCEHNFELHSNTNIIVNANEQNKNYVIKNNVNIKGKKLIFNIKKIKKLEE